MINIVIKTRILKLQIKYFIFSIKYFMHLSPQKKNLWQKNNFIFSFITYIHYSYLVLPPPLIQSLVLSYYTVPTCTLVYIYNVYTYIYSLDSIRVSMHFISEIVDNWSQLILYIKVHPFSCIFLNFIFL